MKNRYLPFNDEKEHQELPPQENNEDGILQIFPFGFLK